MSSHKEAQMPDPQPDARRIKFQDDLLQTLWFQTVCLNLNLLFIKSS